MKVLGRWATIGFAYLAAFLGEMIAVAALGIMVSATERSISAGTEFALATLISNSVQVVLLMLASRLSKSNVLVYLGLDIPRWQYIAIATAGFAVWTISVDALTLALGRDLASTWALEIYRSARAEGSLIWLWLAMIVAAPVGEELLYRGFMFRGFVHAPRDAIPSIVVISLLWSLRHGQYDWFNIVLIFVFGMLLGLARWTTGSTTLAIFLHTLFNLEASIEIEFLSR
jgi:membrane protease YdiL (CAAX protease family)